MTYLTVEQLSNLVGILSEENVENQTLEYLVLQLHKYFKKADNFKVGCSLLMLIQHSDFLFNQTQVFAAIILCYELYQNDPIATNPLAPIFVHLLHKKDVKNVYVSDLPDLTMPAKIFLSNLIMSQNPKELLRKTAKQVLTAHSNPSKPIVNTAAILNKINDYQNNLPRTAKSSLPVIIPDPQKTETEVDVKQVLETLICGPKSYVSHNFKPEMMRLVPPLYVCENEMVWLVMSNRSNHQIMYDKTMCISTSFSTEARKLMTKALKAPLNLRQQQLFLAEIGNDPKLVYQLGLTPCKLPDLIECNPLLAIDVLLKLMQSHDITDYFFELVNMDLSLHSMEVVNRLTITVELPTEFVHLYISNCIVTCETIKDQYMQNRLVRLVCVFLQSLIRNNIINVQELFMEVQGFCINFIQIREASALFRLLKELEISDTSSFGKIAAIASITPSTISAANNKDKEKEKKVPKEK